MKTFGFAAVGTVMVYAPAARFGKLVEEPVSTIVWPAAKTLPAAVVTTIAGSAAVPGVMAVIGVVRLKALADASIAASRLLSITCTEIESPMLPSLIAVATSSVVVAESSAEAISDVAPAGSFTARTT